MKAIPSNQTLILANERGVSGGRPAAALGHAARIGSGDSVLKRVTIVAAHPDTTLVYLQADYAFAEPSPQAPRGSPQALDRGVGLYASTQRILAEAPATAHIDVYA
jgi:hypothetical protein